LLLLLLLLLRWIAVPRAILLAGHIRARGYVTPTANTTDGQIIARTADELIEITRQPAGQQPGGRAAYGRRSSCGRR